MLICRLYKRISSSVEALSNSQMKLDCKVSQLVKLIKDKNLLKCLKEKAIILL